MVAAKIQMSLCRASSASSTSGVVLLLGAMVFAVMGPGAVLAGLRGARGPVLAPKADGADFLNGAEEQDLFLEEEKEQESLGSSDTDTSRPVAGKDSSPGSSTLGGLARSLFGRLRGDPVEAEQESEAEEDGDEEEEDEDHHDHEHEDEDEDEDGDDEDEERRLGEEKLNKIREAGLAADRNKDGLLSVEEMLLFAETIRGRQREAHTEDVLGRLDMDESGKVSIEEAQKGLRIREDFSHTKLRFETADMDKDGHLHKEELHSFLHPEQHPETLHIESSARFRSMDTDKDGIVTLQEFLKEVKLGEEEPGDFSEPDAKADFHAHDTDRNGSLSEAEFSGFIRGDVLLLDQARKAMKAGDGDADGHIHLQDELPRHLETILDSEFVEDYFLLPRHGHEEL